MVCVYRGVSGVVRYPSLWCLNHYSRLECSPRNAKFGQAHIEVAAVRDWHIPLTALSGQSVGRDGQLGPPHWQPAVSVFSTVAESLAR